MDGRRNPTYRRRIATPIRLAFGLAHHVTQLSHFVAARRLLLQAGAGAIAFGLGLRGWMIHAPPTDFAGLFNNIFRTAQLVTLQFPTSLEHNIPWELQVARLAVPLVAVLATLNVLLGSLTRPLRLALLPITTGHTVVCGAEHLTDAALRLLLAQGRAIVAVSPTLDPARREALEGLGLTVLEADPTLASTFPEVNMRFASALILAEPNDLRNINLAILALETMHDRPAGMKPPVFALRIDRDDLACEWDLVSASGFRQHGIRSQRLCPERDGLEFELGRYLRALTKPEPARRTHVLVLGLIGGWPSILARLVVAIQHSDGELPLLTFVLTEEEEAALSTWRAARPGLDGFVETLVLARGAGILPDTQMLALWRARHMPPQLAIVLLGDADGMAAALGMGWSGNPFGTEEARILVRQSQEAPVFASLTAARSEWHGAAMLSAFGGLVRPESLDRLLTHRGDEIAMLLHGRLSGRLSAASDQPAGGPGYDALVWDTLLETQRDEARSQVAHAPVLLQAAGLELVPCPSPGVAVARALTAEQVEQMARVEHRRGHVTRVVQGAARVMMQSQEAQLPVRSDWLGLSEPERQRCRDVVLSLTTLMQEAGMYLVASDQPPREDPA